MIVLTEPRLKNLPILIFQTATGLRGPGFHLFASHHVFLCLIDRVQFQATYAQDKDNKTNTTRTLKTGKVV
jgi:hypothetical protein